MKIGIDFSLSAMCLFLLERKYMTNYDVVKKLIGEIDPVGETNTDEKRFVNLDETIKLIDQLITDVIFVIPNENRSEFSMKRAGQKAKRCLIHLYDSISEELYDEECNLKKEFEEETGISWQNKQGEPDIDYVQWIENKIKK